MTVSTWPQLFTVDVKQQKKKQLYKQWVNSIIYKFELRTNSIAVNGAASYKKSAFCICRVDNDGGQWYR